MLTVIRYIHNNPVKAGIVQEPEKYRWSSIHAYYGAREYPHQDRGGVFVAAIPESIQQTIKDYLNKIRNQIPVEKAFLFGSYAWGTYTPDSDIDLAIFSSHFEKNGKD